MSAELYNPKDNEFIIFRKLLQNIASFSSTNSSGNLIPADFLTEVKKGNVPGHSFVDIEGRVPLVNSTGGNTAPADIWFHGGIYTGQPIGAPETITITSDDAADTAAGTGMRSIRIFGLKAVDSPSEESEDLILNGLGGVTSINTWYRIYRAVRLTVGSNGSNVGEITINHTTTTANIFAVIGSGFNQSTVGSITIPIGITAFTLRLFLSIVRNNGSPGSAEITYRTRPSTSPDIGYAAVKNYQVSDSSSISLENAGIFVPEQTDVKFTVENVSDNNTAADCDIAFLFVDNTLLGP